MDNTDIISRAKKCIEYNLNAAFVNKKYHKLSRDLLNEMSNQGLEKTSEYIELKDILDKIDMCLY